MACMRVIFGLHHYDDVIMGAIASQITSPTIVYWTVYSSANQSKHQSSASLAFVWRIHRGPVNSRHKWPVTRKMFPLDDVIIMLFNILDTMCPNHRTKCDVHYSQWNIAWMKTTQFRDADIFATEWSFFMPYFNGSFLIVDITFHSVIWTCNVQCVEQHTRQISITYTPYLTLKKTTLFQSNLYPQYWVKVTTEASIILPSVTLLSPE